MSRVTNSVVKEIETPVGLARAYLDVVRTPRAMLVLGHGAGGSLDAPDILAARSAAIDAGLLVVRVQQPYRVAGRRAPAPATQLDTAWEAAIAVVRRRRRSLPLIVGGRSSGARVACRTARAVGAAGVLTLAFPTQPPGKPEKSRLSEFNCLRVPVLVISGEKDPFGVPPLLPNHTQRILKGRAHDLRGPMEEVKEAVDDWLNYLVL